MRDLHVPAGPGLPEGLVVPATELVERFSKSPGPGGQTGAAASRLHAASARVMARDNNSGLWLT